MSMEEKYVIDASSLIDLNKFNPLDIYHKPWEKIEQLIENNLLFSPIEVFKELVKKDDLLAEWVKKHKKMFKPITKRQTEIVSEILKTYPAIINVKKEIKDSKKEEDEEHNILKKISHLLDEKDNAWKIEEILSVKELENIKSSGFIYESPAGTYRVLE